MDDEQSNGNSAAVTPSVPPLPQPLIVFTDDVRKARADEPRRAGHGDQREPEPFSLASQDSRTFQRY